MEGRPVPENCPAVSLALWQKEITAVLDLYLLALAWTSTIGQGFNSPGTGVFTEGLDILEYLKDQGPEYLQNYLRGFCRVSIFISSLGQAFAEPVLGALEGYVPSTEPWHVDFEDLWDDSDQPKQIMRKLGNGLSTLRASRVPSMLVSRTGSVKTKRPSIGNACSSDHRIESNCRKTIKLLFGQVSARYHQCCAVDSGNICAAPVRFAVHA